MAAITPALLPLASPAEPPALSRTYIAQVAPQQETSVLKKLQRIGIDGYCPREPKSVRVNKARRCTIKRPMMPGYVFPIFDEQRDHWESLVEIDGLVRLFKVASRPWPVPAELVQYIHDREIDANMRGKGRAVIHLKIGAIVQFTEDAGACAGCFGKVTALLDAKGRIRADWDVFGRQTPVEVSVNQVRAV